MTDERWTMMMTDDDALYVVRSEVWNGRCMAGYRTNR